MRISSCVPLGGQGVIARYGPLVAVTDGSGQGPDALLGVIAATAEGGADGSEFVIRAARAALTAPRQASWACAGVTADGGLAVLVFGRAAATVRVVGSPEVTLTVSDSMLPVSRTFTGQAITVILVISGATPPDERFRLGDGVVQGGGLAVTATADQAAPRVRGPDGQPPLPAQWDGPAQPAPFQPAQPQPAVAPMPRPDGQVAARAAVDRGAVGAGAPGGAVAAGDRPAQAVAGPPESPVRGTPMPGPVMVEGVSCVNGHFNQPGAWSCRQCGIGLGAPARQLERRPRPPLGELVLDDGTRFPLDGDYVLGREPTLDGDVLAGRARPLRINDPDGTVSRLHLKISLTGWQVEVSDLGSANGSVLHLPDGERSLTPFEPTTIEPGARLGIGHRSMQFLAYQGA